MTFASKWYIAIRSQPPFSVSLSQKRKQGRSTMTAPASATKLPVAGFRRRRERRTDLFAQAMTTGTAVPAALSGALRRERNPPRRARVDRRSYHRLGPRKVQRLCGERRSSGMSETCRLRRGERYGACDDEVVSKCALRDKNNHPPA